MSNLFRKSLLPLALLLTLTGCDTFKPSEPATLGKLMVQRLNWMDEVAQAKQARSLPITDPAREAELLAAMEERGAASGLPAAAVRQFFTGQMQAAKQYQQEWLSQHPQPAPTQPGPDLTTTVRPALDHIGDQMISALAAARRRKEDPAAILTAARHQLRRAGYSSPVTTPALQGLQGLQAALRTSSH